MGIVCSILLCDGSLGHVTVHLVGLLQL